MAIVIENIPSYQVLDETAGATSNLSLFVSGLHDVLGAPPVTASLGGTNARAFVAPPVVSSVSPWGNEFLVILELTGTLVALDAKKFRVIVGRDKHPDRVFDAELTVTICQEPQLCSDAKAVLAIYLAPIDAEPIEESCPA